MYSEKMSYLQVKNVFDLLVALLLVLLLLPLFLAVALGIKLIEGGPILFRQTRVGYKLKEFDLIKFRTMTVNDNRDFGQELDPKNAEITRIGMVLRRLKIDELPQLLNVVKGDMSLIGPRPPLPLLLKEMSDKQKKRFDVLPGLTGLAQVNGNIHIDWQDRFEYDLRYVENLSLHLDFKILLKTILVIIFGEDKFRKSPKS